MSTDSQSEKWQVRTHSLLRQMDWLRGLRAAVALCVPLVLGGALGFADFGWIGLGGYEAILSDPGGPYRSRMRSLATLSIGGGFGVFLGSLAGNSLHWALPLTLVWCFAWSYLAVLGQPFTTAGVLVQVVYICGLGAPSAHWQDALKLGLLLMAGGVWSMVLSLFLWPLDAYRPGRIAVADCYTELASFLASVVELTDRASPQASLWHRLAQHHQYRLRRAVEKAWNAVALVHAKQFAGNVQEQQLVVLLETADMLIARTIAIAEHLETQASAEVEQSGCLRRGMTGLADLQAIEAAVAHLLTRRRSEDAAAIHARRTQVRNLPRSLASCMGQMDASGQFLLQQVTECASLLDTALESAALLRTGTQTAAAARGPAASASYFGYVYERMGQLRQGWNFDLLTANLTRDSLTLRHAARVSLVCGLDVAIMLVGHVNHGYWLLLTSLIVLQPHVAGTLRRGAERIGGTVSGAIVAALLAMVLHSQAVTAAVLFPCALLSLAILPVSYAAFAFFLTPTFVLAWMPYSGDWQLALIRTGNTIGGALLAVASMLFLFPAYERERAPQFLRASLEADRRYLAELAAAWRNGTRSSRILANARRRTGLAHNDAEESLERLLAESWPRSLPWGQFASTFVTYLRRFAQSVTTLTALEDEWEWKRSEPVQNRLALLDQQLEWLHGQITGAKQPSRGSWPEQLVMDPMTEDHPGNRQLERLERQASVLRRQLLAIQEHGWFSSNAKTGKILP